MTASNKLDVGDMKEAERSAEPNRVAASRVSQVLIVSVVQRPPTKMTVLCSALLFSPFFLPCPFCFFSEDLAAQPLTRLFTASSTDSVS